MFGLSGNSAEKQAERTMELYRMLFDGHAKPTWSVTASVAPIQRALAELMGSMGAVQCVLETPGDLSDGERQHLVRILKKALAAAHQTLYPPVPPTPTPPAEAGE